MIILSCCGVDYGSLRAMSKYFSATAQAGNARLSRSDEVVVCLVGRFIAREGKA